MKIVYLRCESRRTYGRKQTRKRDQSPALNKSETRRLTAALVSTCGNVIETRGEGRSIYLCNKLEGSRFACLTLETDRWVNEPNWALPDVDTSVVDCGDEGANNRG